jgi:hypothetical protein
VNWWLRTFCWWVLQLDRIPKYGRYYRFDRVTRSLDKKPRWSFQRHGRWGMNLLIKWKLFGRYIDYMEEIDP